MGTNIFFDRKQKKAIKYIKNNHSDVIRLTENCILKFSVFHEAFNEIEKKKKTILYQGYIASITNNFVVCKKLFIEGWHFQLQIILRTQFEQLQNLICLLFDEEYYEYYSKASDNKDLVPLTPKQAHIQKVLTKFSKTHHSYGRLLKTMSIEMKPLYDEFSKASHGNLMHAMLLSSYPADDDSIIFDIGSSERPYERTLNFFVSFLEFAQLIWFVCHKRFNELNLFELTNISNEFKINLSPSSIKELKNLELKL